MFGNFPQKMFKYSYFDIFPVMTVLILMLGGLASEVRKTWESGVKHFWGPSPLECQPRHPLYRFVQGFLAYHQT